METAAEKRAGSGLGHQDREQCPPAEHPSVARGQVAAAAIVIILDRFCYYHLLYIAEHYLSSQRETGELYCEAYEKVAVLFACIPDFMDSFSDDSDLQVGVECLKMLNEIIGSFDRVRAAPAFSIS